MENNKVDPVSILLRDTIHVSPFGLLMDDAEYKTNIMKLTMQNTKQIS